MSSSLNLIFAQVAAPEGAPAASAPAPAAPAADNAALPTANSQTTAPQTTTGTTVPAPDAQPRQQPPAQDGNSLFSMLPLVLLFVAMYFLLLRPQQKREKEIRKRQSELKNGDAVITSSGIFGKVVGIDGDKVTLQIGEGVRVVFQRQAIVGFTSANDDASKK